MGGNSNSDLMSYVKENATLIDPAEYGETSASQNNNSQKGGPGGKSSSLYYFNKTS